MLASARMQQIIEEAVRWIGFLVLRVITLGWYAGGKERERLPEGAIGLATVAAVVYVAAFWH